jgi:glycerol-3-phosphate dehydrogenase
MGVEMPITEQIHDVLYRGVDAREAVTRLLRRAQKPETH